MEDGMSLQADGRSSGDPSGPQRGPGGDARMPFEQIVAVYRPRVARLAYRLLGWDGEAEDAVQDVFLSVLKNLSAFGGRSSLWTWLATITVNRCHSLRKRRLVRLRSLTSLFRRPPPEVRSSRRASSQPADN